MIGAPCSCKGSPSCGICGGTGWDRTWSYTTAADAAKAHEARLKAEARRAAIAECVAALEAAADAHHKRDNQDRTRRRAWEGLRLAIEIAKGRLDHE